jgi:hypothetical protein
MTFGKHRGRNLEDIDPRYLLWVLDKVHDLSPTLRKAIRDVLGLDAPPRRIAPPRLGVSGKVAMREVVKHWYRGASKRFHPDHGGPTDKQIAINYCYESLMSTIETMEVS